MADILPLDDFRRPHVPPADTYPSRDEIAGRAYVLFIKHGRLRAFGDCWRAAERELLDRGARQLFKQMAVSGDDAA